MLILSLSMKLQPIKIKDKIHLQVSFQSIKYIL